MPIAIPDDMDAVVYFTRRSYPGDKGKIICWARRLACPRCKKGRMRKPIDEKKGTFKTRATEYVCGACPYTEPKADHEAKLTAEIVYTCPFCKKSGDATAPFARKTWYGKKAIVFSCKNCNEKLGVTKKLAIPPQFQAKLDGKPVKSSPAQEPELDEDDDF